jgi:hypothetical protein
MRRSSARRARRWVIQELTRCFYQHSEPLPVQTYSSEAKTDVLRVRSANGA